MGRPVEPNALVRHSADDFPGRIQRLASGPGGSGSPDTERGAKPLLGQQNQRGAEMTTSGEQTPRAVAVRLAAASGVPMALLRSLHDLHGHQWQLEDATRNHQASALRIAEGKAEIDESNARRHRMINAIDAVAGVGQAERATHYYSETIGELCDRLLILDHKLAALGGIGEHADESSAEPWSAAVHHVSKICAHLSVVVTQLIDDMATGRAALPPHAGVKVYAKSLSPDSDADPGASSPRCGQASMMISEG